MSETINGAYGGMNQPPLTSANRPDLAALPAYVEPPREVTKVDRRKNSAFAILLVALGAGICGGLALNEYKQRQPTTEYQTRRLTAAISEAPPPAAPITSPAEVPLPAEIQAVRQAAPKLTRAAPDHLVASRHPGSDHTRPQPSGLTRRSSALDGAL